MDHMKPKLYKETTIPSYLASRPSSDPVVAGHQSITRDWWTNRQSAFDAFISEAVLDEIGQGDPEAVARRRALIAGFPTLETTKACADLAQYYLTSLLLPTKAHFDALHLAIASIYSMDFLVTWNCRHLARGSVMHDLPAINDRFGLRAPTICTPEELLYED